MNQKLILVVFSLLMALTANAKDYLICNTCFSQDDFKAYASGAHAGGTGDYLVVNAVTDELWNVAVENSYEPEVGMWIKYAFISPASAQDVNDYLQLKEVAEKGGFLLTIPDENTGYGAESYASHTREGVGAYIVHDPRYITASRKVSLFKAILRAFGFNKFVVTVVFPNGDVVQFNVIEDQSPALCCTEIPGTARDINGNVLDSHGQSTGHGGGSGDYVQPNPNGDGLIVHMTPVRGFICTSEEIPGGIRITCHPY